MQRNIFRNFNYWRIIEPVLLGSIVNILVNFIFNPSHPDFIWGEFFNAWTFAFIVTETNRKIDIILDKKHNWTKNFNKRFYLHLIYLSLSLLFLINGIGNLYLWIKGEGFHTAKELTIINISVFAIALLLTLMKWTHHFYKNWRMSEVHLRDSTKEVDALKSKITQESQYIELIKGNELYRINTNEVRFAKTEHNVIWVYYQNNQKAVFQGTLGLLETVLPESFFFRVSRNTIVRRDVILAISSSTYGKILLRVKENVSQSGELTVSRPKAASFRKWYYSNST